jgi:hypothetical protein
VHALPFVADALLCKLDYTLWSGSQRVVGAIGKANGQLTVVPKPNPQQYMSEDEDLLNILLWRYKAPKQWCKWDVVRCASSAWILLC